MGLTLQRLLVTHFTGGPKQGAYVTTASRTAAFEGQTVANPTEITITDHYLETGDKATITSSGCTPNLSGDYTITKTGANTFTIPVNVSAVADGTAGTAVIGRITALTGGTNVAILVPYAATDTHIGMKAMAWLLERAYKFNKIYWPLKRIFTCSESAVPADYRYDNPDDGTSDSDGGQAQNLRRNYSSRIETNDDDINDAVVDGVIDSFS